MRKITRFILSMLTMWIICLTTVAQAPANDQCTGAITIPNLTNPVNIGFNNAEADYSFNGTCEGTVGVVNNPDVWYTFVMPFNGNIKLTSTSNSLIYVLYSGPCANIIHGSSLKCDAGNSVSMQNLIAGTTYRLKVGSNIASAGEKGFTIQAFEVANNNTCATATVSSANLLTLRTFNFDNRGASEFLDASCENGADENLDLWYRVTMPVTGNLAITNADDAVSYTIYNTCGGGALSCKKGNQIVLNLLADEYLLRVATRKQASASYSFNMQAFAKSPFDECEKPKLLTNADLTNGIVVNFDARTATESLNASCETATDDNLDEWVSFTMPFKGNLEISEASLLNSFTLYATCGGAEIVCKKGNQEIEGLISGTTYQLRIATSSINAAATSFKLRAIPTISNNDCASATPLTGNLTNGIAFNFENTEANSSGEGDCYTTELDLWYSFSMPFDGSMQLLGDSKLSIGLFESCDGGSIACIRLLGAIIPGLKAGKNYKLRISSIAANADLYNLTIKALPKLANDSCHDAIPITGNLANPLQVATDTRGASLTVTPSCQFQLGATEDVWYSFTMPFNGNLRIEDIEIFSAYFALFTECGGTPIWCADIIGNAGNFAYVSLTGGQTYLMRVATLKAMATQFTFTMQAFPHLPQDNCAGAMLVQPSINCTGPAIMVETRGAPRILAPSTCTAVGTVQGTWFAFDTEFSNKVTISSNSDSNYFALYTSCATVPIACIIKEGSFDNLEWGKRYYLYVYRKETESGSFSFCLQATPVAIVVPTGNTCIPSMPVTISPAAQNNHNIWVPIFSTGGKIIASVKSNGFTLGAVTASVKRGQNPVRTFGTANTPYLRREITINTASVPAGNVSVRLYFTKDEIEDLIAAGGAPTGLVGMGAYKEENVSCTNGYGNNGSFIAANGANYGTADYYIEFNVNSFSTFFPGVDANLLPVKLLSFDAKPDGKSNLIYWTTTQEINSSHFTIERSVNGNEWMNLITTKAEGNSNQPIEYKVSDDLPYQQTYYRLKMVDKDGSFIYSKIVTVKRTISSETLNVYPNPAKGTIRVQANSGQYHINLVGSDGRIVRHWPALPIVAGGSLLNIHGIAPGVYRLQATDMHNKSSVQWKTILIQ